MRKKHLNQLRGYVDQRLANIERAHHLVDYAVRQIEATYLAAISTIERSISERLRQIENAQQDLSVRQAATDDALQQLHNSIIQFETELQQWTQNRLASLNESLVAHLDLRVSDLSTSQNQNISQIRDQIHRVESSTKAALDGFRILVANQTESSASRESAPAPRASTIDPTFYGALEDAFRGSETTIYERFKEYEDWISELQTHDSRLPFVDLGCGRGEFLSFLKSVGINTHGVDSDPVALSRCRENGFDVTQCDLQQFLTDADDNSFSGLSLIHVLEHFDVSQILDILREARRVVADGGVILVETPNPKNLRVGTSNFWLDPTHVRPIPPELLGFIFEFIGLAKINIKMLRSNEGLYDSASWNEGSKVTLNALVHAIDGPMDYAVIGTVSSGFTH
jgi:SAM-dependent methyltransferase